MKKDNKKVKKTTDKIENINEAFKKLDGIIEEMNNEKITLEDSIELYEEGIKVISNIKKNIDTVEKKLKILEQKEDE